MVGHPEHEPSALRALHGDLAHVEAPGTPRWIHVRARPPRERHPGGAGEHGTTREHPDPVARTGFEAAGAPPLHLAQKWGRLSHARMKACPQCSLRYPEDAVFCFLDGATLAEIQDPLIGTTIAGRYVIERVIGEGGMATVYGATHKLVDRPCAVKVMNAQMATDATVRERFRREAKSAQSLAHPNVIEIFDQGEIENGTPYIVMELLNGQTLAELT